LAVAVIVMVTGFGPQLKVMMPPAATAWTTASGVQLAGVPSPITWVGCEASTAWAASGTGASPVPNPGVVSAAVAGEGVGVTVGTGLVRDGLVGALRDGGVTRRAALPGC